MQCNASIQSTALKCSSAPVPVSVSLSPRRNGEIDALAKTVRPLPDRKIRTLYAVFQIDPITGAESMSGIFAKTQLEARRKVTGKSRVIQFQRASEL